MTNPHKSFSAYYYHGQGVLQDHAESYFWLYMATLRNEGVNQEKTAKARDAAAAMLTPAQQADVQERVARWFAEHLQK